MACVEATTSTQAAFVNAGNIITFFLIDGFADFDLTHPAPWMPEANTLALV